MNKVRKKSVGVTKVRIWSVKEVSVILGIHPGSVTSAIEPSLTKVAKLFKADPVKTLDSILDRVRELEAEQHDMEATSK